MLIKMKNIFVKANIIPFFTLTMFLGLTVSACAPVIQNHGNKPSQDVLELIEPKVQTKNDVLAMLGSPSSITMFEEETWLYISSKREQVAFFKPDELEREVVAITFDGNTEKVSNVITATKEDGAHIVISAKETPTSGHSFTFLEQMFGNVGRFENKGN